MNDEQLKREIEESLAVEPSPQFMARVRRHLENEIVSPVETDVVDGDGGRIGCGGCCRRNRFVPIVHACATCENRSPAAPEPGDFLPASANMQASPVIAPKAVSRQAIPHSSEPEVVIDPREAAAFQSFMEDVREQKIDPASLESLFQAAESADAVEIAPMPIAGLEPIDIKPLNPAVTERGGSL